MMDNLAANKSHIPCQSWVGQNGWSTTSAQGPLLSPLPGSQHLGLGSSSDQRPSYNHLQVSSQSCMSDPSTLSSRSSTHHAALYKASNGNLSSTALFSNISIPSASHMISFAQEIPHNPSLLIPANQGKALPPPSLPQTSQAPQLCGPQHLPLLSPPDPYKVPFQPPLNSQGLPNGHQDLPISLPSCGHRVSTARATSEGASVAGVAGYTHSYASSPSQEQCQWMPSSHCRGAVNESVPDAAAHPNKEPPQEGNISPPAGSERQRSVLLHQRAQLLQQLAELDELLKSMPPDDSSDGPSPPTAIEPPPSMDASSQCEPTKTSDEHQVSAGESKSHVSVDCSSPMTCDRPEDPMAAADSEKKENGLGRDFQSDDDGQPGLLPASDSDISDFLSDPDVGSSDEISHNSPVTPADEKPRLPGKKGAKSRISLFKAKSVSPQKKTRAANQKNSSETVVVPVLGSKAHRSYDKRNYCLFCSKPVSKMSRHLESVHSEKTEVAAVFQYPKNSRERQKMWTRLVKQGNFAHNKKVLKIGKGQLAVRKRPKETGNAHDFLHCLYCRGLFVKNSLYRHMKLCPEKVKNENESQIGRKRIASQCALEASEDLGITDGFKSVLSQMTYNDVTRAVMEDKVILQFGELLFEEYGSNPNKHHYIRQNLRQIARLLLEARKTTPLQKLEDFFLPSSFPHVVSAVKVLAGYDPENKTYSIPSLAIKLGYNLQKTCSIVEGNAVKCGDANLAESARNFLSVYRKKWNKLISSGALTALRRTKPKTDQKVLFAKDVKRLNLHMENVHLLAEKKLRDSASAENYAALAKIILIRTILFNRRRSREVSLVQLTAFLSRKKSNLHAGMDISVSDLERTMCGFFDRIYIRGTSGRIVPILLKPSFVSALELLVKLRDTCGVPSKNPFLFGRPHTLSAYSWSDSIQRHVKACGAKDPEALKSAKIRKHYAAMLQVMNLDENEANQILGPNNQVWTLRQYSDMQLDDVEMTSDERFQPAAGQQATSWDHNSGMRRGPAEFYHEQAHGEMSGANMTAPPECVGSSKKDSQNQGKHKWEEAEVLAVERHLMHLIEGHKVPQKHDCIRCLEAEPEALSSRSWKGVKDYVRNRITALKRQSGSSQATSKNHNSSVAVEPQQSTGHFQQL